MIKYAASLALLAISMSVPAAEAAVIVNQITGFETTTTPASANQFFIESEFVGFNTYMVDDFVLTRETTLSSVSASVLGLSNGSNVFTSFSRITLWRVNIYSSLNAALSAPAGDVYNVTMTNLDDWYPDGVFPTTSTGSIASRVTLPVTRTLAAGTYWLSIIPSMRFSRGQTMIHYGGTGNAVTANPNGAFGFGAGGLPRSANMAFMIEGTAIAGVPEPASWAMLIAGFGLVGAAQRRRGRLAAARSAWSLLP